VLTKDYVTFLVLVISRLKKKVAATNYTGPLKNRLHQLPMTYRMQPNISKS